MKDLGTVTSKGLYVDGISMAIVLDHRSTASASAGDLISKFHILNI